MNKDTISEIYKYLNRDVYGVRCLINIHDGTRDESLIEYFYSYDRAYERAKEHIVDYIFDYGCDIDDLIDNLEDSDQEEIKKKSIEMMRNYKENGYDIKNKCDIEACKKVLEKTEEELIEEVYGFDNIINSDEEFIGVLTVSIKKIKINS